MRAAITTTQDRATAAITAFAGSMTFVYLHLVWFVAWALLNLGIFGAAAVFDPFPFGLLTLVVSLESIFLSTFLLISQNQQSKNAALLQGLDYETNVRAEVWTQLIGAQLGLDPAEVEAQVQRLLARPTDPAPPPAPVVSTPGEGSP